MKDNKRNKQRGVALVTVLIAIAITLVITNQFGTSSTTDMIAAANYRDQMRSHFLARSAVNLAELVIRIQQRLDNIKELRGQVQITDFADQLVLPFCGGGDEVRDMIGFSTEQVPGLGADIGGCGFNGPMTTEDDRINVNCANVPAAAPMIEQMLSTLVYFPAYDPLFEEADAEGWRRDRPQQVSAIVDYIDRDSAHGTNLRGGGGEDYGYESLRDKYMPKNNYVDSIGEVKLARGVDDRFWTLFGSSLTVYGGCKVNISAISNPQLIAAILFLSAKNQKDPVILDPRKLFLLAGVVAKGKQFGETFTKLEDFANFVKDPTAAVAAMSSTGGLAGSAAQGAMASGLGIPPGEKIGLELDMKLLGQIAMSGPRRTYRIEAWGEIERKSGVFPPIRSTVTGVWDTKVFPQNVRKPQPKGAWVFLRED